MTKRPRLRGWRLLSAVPWLVVFVASSAGAEVRVATELPGRHLLAAGAGEHAPGLRAAETDEHGSRDIPIVGGCSGALGIEPGFAPWPSPVGAGAIPQPRPILPVAPKTSPPLLSI